MSTTTHQGAEGAETMTAGQSLDLRDLHAANIARQAEWCPDQVPDLSFRGNELGGECGEAQNVIKKLERERQGWRGSRATKDDLADELADVVICADLCAVTADIDLGAAVRRKFNATSEKQGLSVFLPAPAPRTDGGMTAGEVAHLLTRMRAASGSEDEGGDCSCNVAGGSDAWQLHDPFCAYRVICEAVNVIEATPAQPAGAVPDGLRALLKEAADVISGAIGPQHPVAQKIDTAIASHRAWQSAGYPEGTSIGERLRQLREGRNQSLHDVASGIGGTKAHLWNLEQGRSCNPSLDLLKSLSAHFGVTVAYLIGETAGQSAGSGADILAATHREFQRQNGFHRREIEELLTEFGELLLSKVQPAPDSTRTGQGEAEDDQGAVQAIADLLRHHDGTTRIRSRHYDTARAIVAALAARPAAPEAQ